MHISIRYQVTLSSINTYGFNPRTLFSFLFHFVYHFVYHWLALQACPNQKQCLPSTRPHMAVKKPKNAQLLQQ